MSSSPSFTSLVHLLESRALETPDALALEFLELDGTMAPITYTELAGKVRTLAATLKAQGAFGQRVLLLFEPGIDYIVSFFACLYAGAIAVPVYPPNPARLQRSLPRLLSIAHDAQPKLGVMTSMIAQLLEFMVEDDSPLKSLTWIVCDDLTLDPTPWDAANHPCHEDLAFLQYTSGSTSTPKGVMLSHANLLANLDMIREAFSITTQSRGVIWLPPYHDMGLIGGILEPLFKGFPVTLMSPLTFLQNPMLWIETIANTKATISGGPNFAYDLCVKRSTPEQRASLDLSHWELAFTGAEPIRHDTLDRFCDAFATAGFKRSAFYPCYGLAEATLIVTGKPLGQEPKLLGVSRQGLSDGTITLDPQSPEVTLVSCGPAQGAQQLQVVDPLTLNVCAEHTIGEVWVKGANVSKGYWANESGSQDTFGQTLPGHPGAWMRTGDLGALVDGELIITGRSKDLIILRGLNIYPQDVEEIAETSHPCVSPGATAAFSRTSPTGEEVLVVIAEVRGEPDHEEVAAAIQTQIAQRAEVSLGALYFISKGDLRKTSSGKIQRRANKAALEQGEFDLLWSSTSLFEKPATTPTTEGEPLPAELANILAEQGVQASNTSLPLVALGLDSLQIASLAHAIERTFNIRVPLRAMFELDNLKDLAAWIEAQPQTASDQLKSPPVDPTSLTAGEMGIWLAQASDRNDTSYLITRALELHGELDIARLTTALEHVVQAHDALRTTFTSGEHGHPTRHVSSTPNLWLTQETAQELDPNFLSSWSAEPLNLETQTWSIKLFRHTATHHVLALKFHHIVCDMWSLRLLMEQWSQAYTQGAKSSKSLSSSSTQDLLHHAAIAQANESSKHHWSTLLHQSPQPMEWPQTTSTTRGVERISSIKLGKQALAPLSELAIEQGISLTTLLLTPLALGLSHHTQQRDLLIGIPFHARTHADSANLFGYCVNLFFTRHNLLPQDTLLDALNKTDTALLDAWEHAAYPLRSVLDALKHKTTEPLQVTFDLQRGQGLEGWAALAQGFRSTSPVSFGPLTVTAHPFETQRTAQFDLSLTAIEHEDGLILRAEYDSARLSEELTQQLLQGWTQILSNLPSLLDHPLMNVELAQPPAPSLAPPALSHSTTALFFDHPAQEIALEWEDHTGKRQTLTYGELKAKVTSIAKSLASSGVSQGDVVGIEGKRGVEFVANFLATLRLGATALPLSPDLPKERLELLLQDAECTQLLGFDTPLQSVDNVSTLPPEPLSTELPAYILYTSGSTGVPKGVVVGRGALFHHACCMMNVYTLSQEDRVLQFAQPYFDVALEEILPTLAAGATLCLPQEHTVRRELQEIVPAIERWNISVLNLPASYWQLLGATMAQENLPLPSCVNLVIAGSEPVFSHAVSTWWQVPGTKSAKLFNAYGPTEATITATIQELYPTDDLPWATAPIGRPLPHVHAWVLGTWGEHLAPGITGELYLGGEGLALGYLKRPEETNASFIPAPWDASVRLYRTGDLAMRTSQGDLVHMGRDDQQVKVRGHRIEIGEVESALLRQPGVTHAAVVCLQAGTPRASLLAFVCGTPQEPLLEGIAHTLPPYMVPARWQSLKALPTLPSGKVDRRALSALALNAAGPATSIVQSNDPKVTALLEAWATVLEVPDAGLDANFFELGGDSLRALEVVSLVRAKGWQVTARQLFEHQTVEDLAPYLEPLATDKTFERPQGTVPLMPLQEAFFGLATEDQNHWNQELFLQSDEALEMDLWSQALSHAIGHHDAFRLRYTETPQGWMQTYEESTESLLVIQHHEVLKDLAVVESHAAALRGQINLQQGPLAACMTWHTPEGTLAMWLAAHHLIVDAMSWRIVLEDAWYTYSQLAQGKLIEDVHLAQSDSLKSWSEALQDADHDTATAVATQDLLPTGTEGEVQVCNHQVSLQDQTIHLLHQAKLNLEEVAVAALTQAWCGQFGTDELRFDLEGHGRDLPLDQLEVDRTVGWFTRMIPCTTHTHETLTTHLKATKQELASAKKRWPNASAHGPLLVNFLGEIGAASVGPWQMQPLQTKGARHPSFARTHAVEMNLWLGAKNTLHIEATFHPGTHSLNDINAMLTAMGNDITQAVTHCQGSSPLLVPADYPSSGLNQAQLDHLLGLHKPRAIEDIYTLSPVQESMVFHHLYSPDSAVTLEQTCFRLQGDLNVEVFQASWQHVVDRHEALRASFAWEGLDAPVQLIHANTTLPFEVLDWRADNTEQQQQKLHALVEKDRQRGYKLSQAPLMRLYLIQCDHDVWEIVWSHHHLILDGWCLHTIIEEVDQCYRALSQGQTPQMGHVAPFSEYIAWLREQSAKEAETFWRSTLAGFTQPTNLTEVSPWPAELDPESLYGRAPMTLDPQQAKQLTQLAKSCRVTLNTLVQGCWALLLKEYTGQRDVVFGATTSGRPSHIPHVSSMVGCFMNTLPRRVQADDHLSITEMMRGLQDHQEAARLYEHTPLSLVRASCDVARSSALYDLYESIVIFEDYPLDAMLAQGLGGHTIQGHEFETQMDYPLVLYVFPKPHLNFILLYDTAKVAPKWAEHIAKSMQNLLRSLSELRPSDPIAELTTIDQASRAEIQRASQGAPLDLPSHDLLDQVNHWSKEHPEKPALIVGDETMTWAQFGQHTSRIAARIQQEGLGQEDVVALCVPRSFEMMTSLYGALKAGVAYVAIDPEYPAERIQALVKDSQAKALLTHTNLVQDLPKLSCPVIALDGESLQPGLEDHYVVPEFTPEQLAYILYTSGSTGVPKGVQISRGQIHASTLSRPHVLPSQVDRYLQLNSYCFDGSNCGMYWTMIAGGTMVLLTDELRNLAVEIPRLLHEHHITHVSFTASLYSVVLDLIEPESLPLLDTVILGGEALDADVVARHLEKLPHTHLINEYGPTEASVWALTHLCTAENTTGLVPIGKPIANLSAYVLDPHMNLVEEGRIGELYLSGAQVARGYLDRPGLSAARFLPDPFSSSPGARMYRTGDLACRMPGDEVVFMGREDEQLKVRGFRIEPGEVEAHLRKIPAIQEVAVVAPTLPSRERVLAAYVVMKEGETLHQAEVQDALKTWLPHYMIPSHLISLDALPKTSTDKLDRKALTSLPLVSTQKTQDLTEQADRAWTKTEQQLASIWEHVLGHHVHSVHDDFFALGGHSLAVVRVLTQIEEAWNASIPLRELFSHTTIAALAQLVDSTPSTHNTIPVAPRQETLPLSFAQQRMWFLHTLSPQSTSYHIPTALKICGEVNTTALEQALNHLLKRHEVLRCAIVTQDGVGVQICQEVVTTSLHHLNFSGSLETSNPDLRKLIKELHDRPFDLSAPPLIRGTLIQANPQEHLLLLTMHHMVGDGWSLGVMVQELMALYQAFDQDQTPVDLLPPLEIQHHDWACWQRDWVNSDASAPSWQYWLDTLSDSPVLELPLDHPRHQAPKDSGNRVSTTFLSETLVQRVHTLSIKLGVTPIHTFMATYHTLLSRLSGQRDVTIGMPVANRHGAASQALIGCLISTVVLRQNVEQHTSFASLCEATKHQMLDALTHQSIPFERLVEALNPDRDLHRTPLFQALFVHEEQYDATLDLPGLQVEAVDLRNAEAKFDLTLRLDDLAKGMNLSFEAPAHLFTQETIDRFASCFLHMLEHALSTPEQSIDTLPLAPKPVQATWLHGAEHAAPHASDLTLLNGLLHQVRASPQSLAVADTSGERLTWQDLEVRSRKLAAGLIHAGTTAKKPVVIAYSRDTDAVVAMVAALRAHVPFLVIEEGVPNERARFMTQDAKAALVLSPKSDTNASRWPADVPVLAIDACLQESTALPQEPTPQGLAYLVYTSGSTGKPKAVGITRGNLAHYTQSLSQTCLSHLDKPATFLCVSNLGMDLGYTSIFPALHRGDAIVLASADAAQDAQVLDAALDGIEIDVLKITPTHFQALVAQGATHLIPKQALLLGGEALDFTWASSFALTHPELHMFNHYGPSETTIGALVQPLSQVQTTTQSGTVPLGKPLPGMRRYVLGQGQTPVPFGCTGELWLAGPQVAAGYMGQEELTNSKFVPDPFVQEDERMYATGDRVRLLRDGSVEFLGRFDDQLKIRGFRVEVGEVEDVIRRCDGVQQAVVLPVTLHGKTSLVAWVTGTEDVDAVSMKMKQFLPGYMIPQSILSLTTMPLTEHGKVDRHTLKAIWAAQKKTETITPPQTPTQHELAKIWCDLLELEHVGIHQDFFVLGGHSLLAMNMLPKLRQTFTLEIQVRDLFERTTISQVAHWIDEQLVLQDEQLDLMLLEELEGLSDEEIERRLAQFE